MTQQESVISSEELQSGIFAKAARAAVVGMAGASLLFEQSPLNEALRINWGLDVLQSTGSATAVGLTIFGITAAIEGASSGLITAGLHSNEGAVQRFKEKMSSSKDTDTTEPVDEVVKKHTVLGRLASAGADIGIALGLGAGLVTMKHHMTDPNPSISKDIKTSIKATTAVAGVSGMIGYLAAGGIANAEKLGLERPAQLLVDYGTDTKFWMTLLAVGYGVHFLKKGVQKIRSRQQKNGR